MLPVGCPEPGPWARRWQQPLTLCQARAVGLRPPPEKPSHCPVSSSGSVKRQSSALGWKAAGLEGLQGHVGVRMRGQGGCERHSRAVV